MTYNPARTTAIAALVVAAFFACIGCTPPPTHDEAFPPQVAGSHAVNLDYCTPGAVTPDMVRCVVVIIDEPAYGYPTGTYLRGPAYYFTTVRHSTVEDPAAS